MTLDDLLAQTMVGTAAKGAGLPLVPVAAGEGPFRSPKPLPQTAADLGGAIDPDTVRRNPIWRFGWDPSNPGTFSEITCASRGMGMDYGMSPVVFESIEARQVRVKRADNYVLDLLLSPNHCMGAFWVRRGEILASSGLWQLDTYLDCSIVVLFGYVANADVAIPLPLGDARDLGDTLIPAADLGPRALDFIAGQTSKAWVCVGDARYIVAVELACCKEHCDFVPGEMIGFARLHPHVMVWSNEDLKRVEATLVLRRPKHGMAHGAMGKEHRALVVADTNYAHDPSASSGKPLPTTDRLYDYYETEPATVFADRPPGDDDHPLQRKGEITLADARFRRPRTIEAAVKRDSPLVSDDPDIVKEPRQGQFDNVHIAARMKLVLTAPNGETLVDNDVVMLNACVHDCTHMHVRWSSFLTDKIMCGWKHGRPYAEAGAPLVPENQTVFASFPNEHSLVYRAVATKQEAGVPAVFCHHGLAYAIDVWPTSKAATMCKVMFGAIEALANEFEEPFWSSDCNDEWARFYWRIRYAGKHAGRYITLRSKFDLETCMR
jgi:hypothetical protein